MVSPEHYPPSFRWFAAIFPNTHAIDPLRQLVLFQTWPVNWEVTLLKLTCFAAVGLGVGMLATSRQLRRWY